MRRPFVQIPICLFLAAWFAPTIAQELSPVAPPVLLREFKIERAVLKDLDRSGYTVTMEFSAVAARDGRLQELSLEQVALADIPVSVPTLIPEIEMHAGKQLDDIPSLEIRVNFADIPSLGPIRRAIQDRAFRVQGTAWGKVRLGAFQKLLLLSQEVWVRCDIDTMADLEIPGGVIGQTGALGTLYALEPAWRAGKVAAAAIDAAMTRMRESVQRTIESMLYLETAFEARTKGGEATVLRRHFLAFATEGGIVSVAEAVEPWAFDPEVARKIAERTVHIAKSTVTTHQGMQLSQSASPRGVTRIVVDPDTRKRYRMTIRNSSSNLVIFKQTGGDKRLPVTVAKQPDEGGDWVPAFVIRVKGESLERPDFSQSANQVRMENGRVVLRYRVDSTVFGSPIVIESGVIGIVQDGTSGFPIS